MSKRIPIISQKQVTTFLKPRPRDSHKSQFGTVTVIGGAGGMVGAPLLAARAALKMGAGCVHVGLLAENYPSVDPLQAELMLHNAQIALHLAVINAHEPNGQGKYAPPGNEICDARFPHSSSLPEGERDRESLRESHTNVLAVGCGMGQDFAAEQILQQVLPMDAALVLDADALNLIARHDDLRALLRARSAATVITPHPGEASHLLGCSAQQVQAARLEAVQELAELFACCVVLKGADSLCATSDGKIHVNKTGNPGMSSPGMGDVLSGMIAAFIAQGLNADQALLLAVHLHGAAADALAQQGIVVGMTATDVTEWARWLLNQWHK